MEPLVPTGGTVLLHGAPKSGKSYLALGLALALAKGEPWLGHPVTRPVPVFYTQLDNPRSSWRGRFQTLVDHDITLPPNLFIADKESSPYPFNILSADHLAQMRVVCNERQPEVVIVDTLREFYRGDENDNDRLQQVFAAFHAACAPAAMIYVHHSRKLPADGLGIDNPIDNARGSNLISGSADTILSISSKHDKRKGDIFGALTYQGRSIGLTEIKLRMNPLTFLWELPESATSQDAYHTALHAALAASDFASDADRARFLHATFPDKAEASIKMDLSRGRK